MIAPCETNVPPTQMYLEIGIKIEEAVNGPQTVSEQAKDSHISAPTSASEEDS